MIMYLNGSKMKSLKFKKLRFQSGIFANCLYFYSGQSPWIQLMCCFRKHRAYAQFQ